MKIYLIPVCTILKKCFAYYLHNTIFKLTRQFALIDPIILHEEMSSLNQGIIKVPSESGHCSTKYVYTI